MESYIQRALMNLIMTRKRHYLTKQKQGYIKDKRKNGELLVTGILSEMTSYTKGLLTINNLIYQKNVGRALFLNK